MPTREELEGKLARAEQELAEPRAWHDAMFRARLSLEIGITLLRAMLAAADERKG